MSIIINRYVGRYKSSSRMNAAAADREWFVLRSRAWGRGRPLTRPGGRVTVILIRSDPPRRPQPQIWSKTRVRGRQWVTAGMWFKGHCRWRKWLCGGGGLNNTWPDTDGCSRYFILYRTWRHCFWITPFNRFDFVTLFFIKQHHDFFLR